MAAVSAWTARETFRVHMKDLGNKSAQPVPKVQYETLREQALRDSKHPHAASASAPHA